MQLREIFPVYVKAYLCFVSFLFFTLIPLGTTFISCDKYHFRTMLQMKNIFS